MRFFRPDTLRIVLFVSFFVVAFFGWRESLAFSDGPAATTGIWTIWIVLLAPLGLLPFDLFRSVPLIFWLVQIAYFYLLACVIASVAAMLMTRR